jgi:hypothetical protein
VEALWRVTVWGLTGRRFRRRQASGGGIPEIIPPD